MLDSRKTNPTCQFAEEVVSYLYNEIHDDEKIDFENHLRVCSSCPDELAAFSSLSSSMQEWRDNEFANMQTPAFDVPYERDAKTVRSESSASWIESLRRYIDFSPVLLRTATALGALAVVLGLGWFLISGLSLGTGTIVEKQDESSKPNLKQSDASTQTPAQVAVTEKNNASDVTGKDEPLQVTEIAKETPPKATPIKVNRKVVKTRVKKVNSLSNDSRRKRPLNKKVVKPTVVEEVPRLTEEVAVEDTDELRLTDIFSEVGSDDK